MTTDITELALIKGQKVEAPYYLAECTECGKMYSSSKLIVSSNYFDGDTDCYCPHCNADDADIADLGSGEQPAVMAWNYQQARIDVLVEALEKAQTKADVYDMLRDDYGLREKGVGLADFVDWQAKRIAELDSRAVNVKLLTPEVRNALKAEGLADVLKDAAEYAPLTAGQWETLTKNWYQTFIGLSGTSAGIKVEAE